MIDAELNQAKLSLAAVDELWRRDQSADPDSWSAETDWPWLGHLDAADIADFSAEMQDALQVADQTGDQSLLKGTLHSWKSTAEVYADPEQLHALLDADID